MSRYHGTVNAAHMLREQVDRKERATAMHDVDGPSVRESREETRQVLPYGKPGIRKVRLYVKLRLML